MKRKLRIPAFLIYITSIFTVSMSIAMLIKINLGISVITSLPYTLFEITQVLSIGMFVTIIQIIFLTTEIIVLKRATVSMLLSFITAYLLGLFIDIFNVALQGVVIEGIVLRVAIALGATLMLGMGAGLLVFSKYPPVPDLIFTRDIANAKGWSLGKMKQILDVSFLITSVTLSLVFLRNINSIGISTVLCVLIVGRAINVFSKVFGKFAIPHFFVGQLNFTNFIEFNLIDLIYKKQTDESR